MILPNKKDAIHKAWLYRTLTAICDDKFLSGMFYFKGGTCAAMRGFLDRFSVDLDFDFIGTKNDLNNAEKKLEKIFIDLGLEIKDHSEKIPQYFLKYQNKPNERNTLKIDVSFPVPKANKYEPVRLDDIDRIISCQTIETMFANKLVALIERYEKNKSIAGRDLYDIHYFFMNNHGYDKDVIIERRNIKNVKTFLKQLINFIEKNITETIINQDLNTLLPPEKFQQIKKGLKLETLMFLKDEMKRCEYYNLQK